MGWEEIKGELDRGEIDFIMELARNSYGSGDKEKVAGGNGYIGMLGERVIKFRTHWGERIFGLSQTEKDNTGSALNRLKGILEKLERSNTFTAAQKNEFRRLINGLDDTHTKSLLKRSVSAQTLSSLGGEDLWREATAGRKMSSLASTGKNTAFATVANAPANRDFNARLETVKALRTEKYDLDETLSGYEAHFRDSCDKIAEAIAGRIDLGRSDFDVVGCTNELVTFASRRAASIVFDPRMMDRLAKSNLDRAQLDTVIDRLMLKTVNQLIMAKVAAVQADCREVFTELGEYEYEHNADIIAWLEKFDDGFKVHSDGQMRFYQAFLARGQWQFMDMLTEILLSEPLEQNEEALAEFKVSDPYSSQTVRVDLGATDELSNIPISKGLFRLFQTNSALTKAAKDLAGGTLKFHRSSMTSWEADRELGKFTDNLANLREDTVSKGNHSLKDITLNVHRGLQRVVEAPGMRGFSKCSAEDLRAALLKLLEGWRDNVRKQCLGGGKAAPDYGRVCQLKDPQCFLAYLAQRIRDVDSDPKQTLAEKAILKMIASDDNPGAVNVLGHGYWLERLLEAACAGVLEADFDFGQTESAKENPANVENPELSDRVDGEGDEQDDGQPVDMSARRPDGVPKQEVEAPPEHDESLKQEAVGPEEVPPKQDQDDSDVVDMPDETREQPQEQEKEVLPPPPRLDDEGNLLPFNFAPEDDLSVIFEKLDLEDFKAELLGDLQGKLFPGVNDPASERKEGYAIFKPVFDGATTPEKLRSFAREVLGSCVTLGEEKLKLGEFVFRLRTRISRSVKTEAADAPLADEATGVIRQFVEHCTSEKLVKDINNLARFKDLMKRLSSNEQEVVRKRITDMVGRLYLKDVRYSDLSPELKRLFGNPNHPIEDGGDLRDALLGRVDSILKGYGAFGPKNVEKKVAGMVRVQAAVEQPKFNESRPELYKWYLDSKEDHRKSPQGGLKPLRPIAQMGPNTCFIASVVNAMMTNAQGWQVLKDSVDERGNFRFNSYVPGRTVPCGISVTRAEIKDAVLKENSPYQGMSELEVAVFLGLEKLHAEAKDVVRLSAPGEQGEAEMVAMLFGYKLAVPTDDLDTGSLGMFCRIDKALRSENEIAVIHHGDLKSGHYVTAAGTSGIEFEGYADESEKTKTVLYVDSLHDRLGDLEWGAYGMIKAVDDEGGYTDGLGVGNNTNVYNFVYAFE